MTEQEINDKHERIRGSDDLKYPANNMRCAQTCGHNHDEYRDREGKTRYKPHRCFLAVNHAESYCQFSSECSERRVRLRSDIVTVGGVAAWVTLKGLGLRLSYREASYFTKQAIR